MLYIKINKMLKKKTIIKQNIYMCGWLGLVTMEIEKSLKGNMGLKRRALVVGSGSNWFESPSDFFFSFFFFFFFAIMGLKLELHLRPKRRCVCVYIYIYGFDVYELTDPAPTKIQ
ncbi:hypothetical protein PanWU01x14_170370, partial [Parasponia andersonii]